MKKANIKVEYEEEKLKGIAVSLTEKGRDLDKEILAFLDGLYEKNVPKVLKNFIENDLKIQSKDKENDEIKSN